MCGRTFRGCLRYHIKILLYIFPCVSCSAVGRSHLAQPLHTYKLAEERTTHKCLLYNTPRGSEHAKGCVNITRQKAHPLCATKRFQPNTPPSPPPPCSPVSTHRRVLISVDVVSDVSEVHMPLDHLEVSRGCVAPLKHNAERIAPTGPFHSNQLRD